MMRKGVGHRTVHVLCIIFCVAGLSMLYVPRVSAGADVEAERGLFVSLIQDPPVLISREGINELIDFAKRANIKTLFVQIYRANCSWFPSDVGDTTAYRSSLETVFEDPFALLIRRAHQEGLEVHAWLNLLSLSVNANARLLNKYGPSILTRNTKQKGSIRDYMIDNQYFLEPGDPRVREELGKMVDEILEAYPDLDGVQFDYIRYPDKDPAYGHTEANVARYTKATGKDRAVDADVAWQDWKRSQVTGLLEELVKRVRVRRPHMRISTTGCAPFVRAYYEAFQDWPSWLNSGLVDFVTVMTYSQDFDEFARFVSDAQMRVVDPAKINIAVGAYKLINDAKRFSREIDLCERSKGGSCVIFHYGSLIKDPSLGNVLCESPRARSS